MASAIVDSKQFIKEYFNAMTNHPRTEDLINQYVSDPGLKEHIRRSEAAFPGYGLIAHQIVAEGDIVAVRGTFHGVHRGEFAGIAPTERQVSGDMMIFYRIDDGRIVEHWMQFDLSSLISQLTGQTLTQ